LTTGFRRYAFADKFFDFDWRSVGKSVTVGKKSLFSLFENKDFSPTVTLFSDFGWEA
jgi:hypothetical protein